MGKSVLHLLIITDTHSKAIFLTQILAEKKLFFSYDLVIGEQDYIEYCQKQRYQGIFWLDPKQDFACNLSEKLLKFISLYQQFQGKIPVIVVLNFQQNWLIDIYLRLGFTGYIRPEKCEDCLKKLQQEYFNSPKKQGQNNKLGMVKTIQHDAIALYQQQLEQQLKQQKEREQFLDCIDRLFDSEAKIDTILQATVEKIGIFFNVERVLGLVSDESNVWVKYEWCERSEISSLLGLKLSASVWQEELTTTEKLEERNYFLAVNYPEYCRDQSHNVQNFKKDNPLSILSVPSVFRGKYYGGLSIQTISQERQFSQIDIKMLGDIARRIAMLLSQVQQQEIAAKLERENHQKSEHFSMMSHDLRTPLTGIVGFARMLLDQIYGDLNPKQMEYISAIASSSEHLLELINDLLDLARIEANREELYLEKLSIEEVCLASLSMVKQLATAKDLELKLDINPDLDTPTCMADQRRLKQILVNLLSNAIKFTEVGSVTLKVDLTLNLSECAVLQFSVIDTGIGIAEEDLDKLFQPFSQIKNPLQSRYKGTGLGLALSKKLARLHGGNLSVTSQLEKGSCFTFDLPF